MVLALILSRKKASFIEEMSLTSHLSFVCNRGTRLGENDSAVLALFEITAQEIGDGPAV